MALGLADTFIAYKFIKILATRWHKQKAYKLGIIDKKGKRIDTPEADEAVRNSGMAYTMMHRVIFNIKRLLSKLPGGKTRLGGFAAALWLLKEETKKMGLQDDTLIERTFLDYLSENGYEVDTLNESFENMDKSISPGLYILNENKVVLNSKLESFDTCLGIPLFRLDDKVFTKDNLKVPV